jgi:diacylglycerol kinase (ATP)
MQTEERSLLRRSADGLRGLAQGWRREKSLRTQVRASVIAMAVVLLLQPPLLWQVALAAMLAVGFGAELLNGSIEALLDRVHPDYDDEIGAAKDMSSAAVLVINIASTTIFVGSVAASFWSR